MGNGGEGNGGVGNGATGGTGGNGGTITVDAGTFDLSANMTGTAQSAAGVMVVTNNSGFGSLVQQGVTVQANLNLGAPLHVEHTCDGTENGGHQQRCNPIGYDASQ